ncbi:MAG: hypothetical protein JXA30_07795 [Deltaproteobacteria bacterium]|nr:hypothetical protein [Deltaproteobacteria bacterium]
MDYSQHERRNRRSEECGTALRFQLESLQQRGSMEALALCDNYGLLLAWAGEEDLCKELGAFAPIVARCPAGSLEVFGADGADVSVRSIDYFGQKLYLASLGGDCGSASLLNSSVRGIYRILTSN